MSAEYDILYTIEEVACFLGISVKATRNRLSTYYIRKTSTVDRKSMFSVDKVAQLKLTYIDRRKQKEEFEFIESKLNTM